jgi:hypothetical protein
MKKESLVVILIFGFLLFGLIGFVNAVTCIDSDLGNSIYIPGNVSGVDSSGQSYNLIDFCATDLVDSLVEYSCNQNGEAVSTTFECSLDTICSYGACVTKENAGKCTDSDSGMIPYVKGEVSGYDLNNKAYEFSDSCSDVYLTEYYCNQGVEQSSEIWDCSPGECINGACVKSDLDESKESIPSLTNSWKYLSFALIILVILIIFGLIIFSNIIKKRNRKVIKKNKRKTGF